MDLNPRKKDRVAAQVRVKGSANSVFVVLGEIEVKAGVFRGSINTQQYFMPVKKGMLNVRSGETVELVYQDLRAEYGEAGRTVISEVKVGWPVMKLNR